MADATSSLLNIPAPATLGQQRAGAIRTALGGLARNVGLSDVEKRVLAQRQIEETPLSANERALAGIVIQDFLASQVAPGAPADEVQRLSSLTVNRMNRRDYDTLVQVVQLGMQRQRAVAAEVSARRPRGGSQPPLAKRVLKAASDFARQTATAQIGLVEKLDEATRNVWKQVFRDNLQRAFVANWRAEAGRDPGQDDIDAFLNPFVEGELSTVLSERVQPSEGGAAKPKAKPSAGGLEIQ